MRATGRGADRAVRQGTDITDVHRLARVAVVDRFAAMVFLQMPGGGCPIKDGHLSCRYHRGSNDCAVGRQSGMGRNIHIPGTDKLLRIRTQIINLQGLCFFAHFKRHFLFTPWGCSPVLMK
ncbi:hypothetical protein D3C71_1671380 [compost metagenome]